MEANEIRKSGESALNADCSIYHYYSNLVGWLELRVTSRGVRSIDFIPSPDKTLTDIDNEMARSVAHELDEYFQGLRRDFTVDLDLDEGTDFQRQVWEELRRIPYGETRSYGEVAAAVGVPKGARAVGSSNKRNPVPIIVPCHRVIKSDGGLGGYDSGLDVKRKLLELEGVSIQL
jgi:methylated-DNA-[protein]-cysteine S-methyltransferase